MRIRVRFVLCAEECLLDEPVQRGEKPRAAMTDRAGEPAGRFPEMPELVMSDFVGDDECGSLVVRAKLQQAPGEEDVAAGRGEGGVLIEPWHNHFEALGRSAVTLQSSRYACDPLSRPTRR